MNDLLNFLLNSLNLLDNKIYDNIKSSLLDNFIHGLQTSNSILDNLPNNTNLHFAKFEGDFAVCFDYSSKTLYNIPKSYLKGSSPEIGDALKIILSKELCVDSTGILANPNNINDIINECSYTNLSTKIFPEYYKISNIGIDFAIWKNINTNKRENIPIYDITKNEKNGDTLIYKHGNFIIK